MNESSESSGGFLSQTPPESSHLTQKMQEIAGEVENINRTLRQFYADKNYQEIVVDKCAVPAELFQKRDGIAAQMQWHENRQIQLSDQIDNEHHKIALLKSQITANRESSSILINLDKKQQIETKQKDLASLLNQHAQKQSDTILTINAGPLEDQVALKKKNEEAMIEVLRRKIEKEKLKIKNIQKERENTEKKTKMLIKDRVIEQQKVKKEKDEQLVMHFIKNFEQGIKKMETIIRNNSTQ